jgi:hypothetical protein
MNDPMKSEHQNANTVTDGDTHMVGLQMQVD